MNVQLPEKEKGTNKRITIYVVIIALCVIAVAVAMYQFFADEKLEVVLGLVKSNEEETEQLKSEFDSLFNNTLSYDKNIVYTGYSKQEKSVNNYDVNINIPYINIDTDIVKSYNNEINTIFRANAEEILKMEDRNIIFNVNYMASVENNILSVAILSNFKEGDNAQRTIIKTYNYDLKNNKEVKLKDLIALNNLDESKVQEKIKSEISKAQENANKLADLGYNIFSRDVNNSMYKIENTTEYFMKNGKLYIIYPYGNKNKTSEMDLVII